jgi:hypothetical protein
MLRTQLFGRLSGNGAVVWSANLICDVGSPNRFSNRLKASSSTNPLIWIAVPTVLAALVGTAKTSALRPGIFCSRSHTALSAPLPPGLGLDSVSQPIRSIQIWRPADKSAKSVRPVRIGHENTQYRPAEKLAAYSNLRRQSKFA